eukprot:232520_1
MIENEMKQLEEEYKAIPSLNVQRAKFVEWWNCSQRDKLKWQNNPSELFNRWWKAAVGGKPNVLSVTNEWREIDANATVDFESHINDPANPDYFYLKPPWKRKRDATITKHMAEYNTHCANNIADTDLEYHTQHVDKMFKLMKCYREELDHCVDENIIYEQELENEIQQSDDWVSYYMN